jgi:hypothetical protein
MNTQQVATNPTFQAFAITETLILISKDTGIPYDALFKQFSTNQELQTTCAKVIVETAKLLTV